ncbi:MAG: hypothetical protein U0169_08725 [Polyangiaceae bacterium]
MAKVVSPLLGFNNNCRHKKRLFHVQTEDSGVKHPHVITHLFADGGRIVKSVKTGYAEHLESENMVDIVREMMKSQHKAMIVALYSGEYDEMLDLPKSPAAEKKTEPEKPTPLASPSMVPPARPQHPSVPPAEGSSAATFGVLAHKDALVMRVPFAEKRSPTRAMPNPLAPEGIAFTPPLPDVVPVPPAGRVAPSDESAPDTRRASIVTVAVTEPADAEAKAVEGIDMRALEKAADEEGARAPLLRRASDLPPPPPNMFREKSTTGEYKAFSPPPEESRTTPTKRGRSIPPPKEGLTVRSSGRIPAARPAFEGPRPSQTGLAAEVSDKSLDDVILDYLRDDFDRPKRK